MYDSSLCSARKVLDHGYVRYVDHMGNDLSIVRSARVSYNSVWRTGEDAGKDEKSSCFKAAAKYIQACRGKERGKRA